MSPHSSPEKKEKDPTDATVDSRGQTASEHTPPFGSHPTLTLPNEAPPAAAPESVPALPVVPGFHVRREVGRGGMGVVYEARQEGLNRPVALKMLRFATRPAVARFHAEAQAIARLNHPDIVQVYAIGDHAGEPYLALEYCPGGTLAQRLESGPLPPHEAARVVARLARAVHAAHQAGVVHRDLKTANVLIAADGSPKVTDFGLAKLLDANVALTAPGDVLGTPCYMAPEQAGSDQTQIGPRTDVYSLGAMLFELLTGGPPFRGANLIETLDLVRKTAPVRPRKLNPDVPQDLESIVLQCLEKSPKRRYASAAELADDLTRWLNGESVRAQRQTIAYRLAKCAQQNRRLVGVAVAAFLAIGTGWFLAADAGYQLPGGSGVRDWLDGREWSAFRAVPSDAKIRERAAAQRERLLRNLANRRFGKGWYGDPNTHFTDPWTQMQVTTALCMAPETAPADLAALVPIADEMFASNAVSQAYTPGFGWPHYVDRLPSMESSAWTLSGVARLFERGAVSPHDRVRLEARLTLVQADLDRYRGRSPNGTEFDGGWLLFANQQDPSAASMYVTVIALQGLLDLRAAGLGWRGDAARRDELLVRTANWLIARFDGTGWRAQGQGMNDYNEGLTLLVLAQLLRAEADGLVQLPGAIVQRLPGLVDECGQWPADHPGAVGVFSTTLREPDARLISSPLRTFRFPWHPWAVRTTVGWIDRLHRTGGSQAAAVRARRALGHMVLDVGDTVLDGIKADQTFQIAEALIGLSAVPPP